MTSTCTWPRESTCPAVGQAEVSLYCVCIVCSCTRCGMQCLVLLAVNLALPLGHQASALCHSSYPVLCRVYLAHLPLTSHHNLQAVVVLWGLVLAHPLHIPCRSSFHVVLDLRPMPRLRCGPGEACSTDGCSGCHGQTQILPQQPTCTMPSSATCCWHACFVLLWAV